MRAFLSRSKLRATLAVGFATLCAACEDQVSAPQPLNPGDIRGFVSSELASQLTSQGTFPLVSASPEIYPQISREQAVEIAVAWARTFGRFHGGYLQSQHGKPIDFDALEVVSPVYYAAGVYEPVPATAPAGARNTFGPQYLLYLGNGHQPVLSVSVAAFTGAWVEDGRLRYPADYGGDVIAQGISASTGFAAPPSPEQAVRLVGAASGVRVIQVPELIRPARDYLPHHARWRVVLDRPLRARERHSGQIRSVTEVYVGLRNEVSVPSEVQEDPGGQPGAGGVSLVRRPTRPVLFEPVHLLQ